MFYVSVSYDARFFSTVSQKFGQLARRFWENHSPPPSAILAALAALLWSCEMSISRVLNATHSLGIPVALKADLLWYSFRGASAFSAPS